MQCTCDCMFQGLSMFIRVTEYPGTQENTNHATSFILVKQKDMSSDHADISPASQPASQQNERCSTMLCSCMPVAQCGPEVL